MALCGTLLTAEYEVPPAKRIALANVQENSEERNRATNEHSEAD
jgi:hypothetical protein